MENYKEHIIELLKQANIGEAIKVFLDIIRDNESSNTELFNTAIILSARYHELIKQFNIGVISYEEHLIQLNKLTYSLLTLTDRLSDYSLAKSTKKEVPLNEAKVVFIGSGNVGKTSLVNMLVNNNFDSNQLKTEGIEINNWIIANKKQKINVHIWDFGGQEIMHATHKFFMTERSLYFIVVNSREEDRYGEKELDYWLKLVNSYAPNSPIVVVINKCEIHPANIDKRTYKINYDKIVDFIETSCVNKTGIDELRELTKTLISDLPHVDMLIPESYNKIKNNLVNMTDDYISYLSYQQICKKIIPDFKEGSMQALVSLLHDLGIILNFRDDIELEDTQVLNPEWVTQGVYRIINSNQLSHSKGVLSLRELGQILNHRKYPRNQHLFIISLMEKFELCYRLPDNRDLFFVPSAFGIERPPNIIWDFKKTLQFQFHYDILPRSVISRLIVRVHKYIINEKYWKDGILIEKDNNQAFINAEPSNSIIKISVKGKEKLKETLNYIRFHLEDIHKGYKALEIKPQIPFEGVLIDYDDLITCDEAEQEEWFIPKLRKKVVIKELINGINLTRTKNIDKLQNENIKMEYKKKILFLASNPSNTGRLRLGEEVREIGEGLIRSKNRDYFHLIQQFAVRPTDLRRTILNEMPNIIHFSGHGTNEITKHGDKEYNGGIILESSEGLSQIVNGEALAKLFSFFAEDIECVILNSCYSIAQAKSINKYISYVIGMKISVSDKAAIAFAIAFYDALGAGRDFEFAFKYAVNSLELEGIKGEDIPILLKK